MHATRKLLQGWRGKEALKLTQKGWIFSYQFTKRLELVTGILKKSALYDLKYPLHERSQLVIYGIFKLPVNLTTK